MHKSILILSAFVGFTIVGVEKAQAETVLQYYENLITKENPKFVGFKAEEGKKIFLTENTKANGEKTSCTVCHTSDPKANGKTRANKIIEPLAPIANKKRFTEIDQVEKWFQRNCKDVLERTCTTEEKGNFTKYMLSIK